MTFLDAFVGGVVISLVALYVKNRYQDVEYVTSTVDGHKYLVRRASNSKEAADTLANINRNIEKLILHLSNVYPNDERSNVLRNRYDKSSLSEGGHNTGYTSFSVNKGEKIVMCIRSREGSDENGDIERFNTLMYVVLHEISHIITDEVGHTKMFWENFKWILDESEKIQIYTKVDYSEEPEKYCGISINSSAAHTKN